MQREGIQQCVLDALGIILVDKSPIHDNATLAELMLDAEDVQVLFQHLEDRLGCQLPDFIRERAKRKPQHVSVPMLVDLLVMLQQDSRVPRGRASAKR